MCFSLFEGIDGILAAYQACISQVRLYGPTNFSPIINHVMQFAAASQQEAAAKVSCLEDLMFMALCFVLSGIG
jgi:hypothetical protein